MGLFLETDTLVDQQYHGSILKSDDYSVALRNRLAECIECYRPFENTGSEAILYIAARKGNDKRIWYEHTSKSFTALLGCERHEIADVFGKSLKDRQIYKDLDVEDKLKKHHYLLENIVKAMSLTLEKRDPYTASHQRRMTDLSLVCRSDCASTP